MRPLLPYLVHTFTAALLFTSAPLHAQPQSAQPSPLGSGGDKCGTWVAARTRERTARDSRITQAALFEEWLRGFVSGALATNPAMKRADSKTAGDFVDTYCREHPSRTLLQAATALIRDLSSARPTAQD